MKSRQSILLLAQELRNDYSYISQSIELWNKAVVRADASRWTDELDLMTVGSCLHTIYNAFEAYFLRIAKFFENSVDQLTWHRDLIDRMGLDVPGTRPALITDPGLLERLDELRRFRHLFRNLYKTKLHGGKLRIVNDAAEGIDQAFLPLHQVFVQWLEDLATTVNEG